MLNYTKENVSSIISILAVSFSKTIIALVVVIVIVLVCFNIAARLVNGIRKGTFPITDTWKVRLGDNFLFFCVLMFVYLSALILFLYAGWIAIYDLLTK